jgi:secreted trypsin-like serine protease
MTNKKHIPYVLGEIWPVCLPESEVLSYAGERATVIGWGKTSGKQSFSSARVLQELNVTVVSQEECQRQWSYGKGRVDIGGPKMCFTSDGSSCHGDSGGGMFLKNGKQRSLIGVCSYGLADCQNWAPEVYTKVCSLSFIFIIKMFDQVSFVLDWIKKVVDGDDLNLENCGVTTARSGQGEGSWKEMGQKFFEGRQVW